MNAFRVTTQPALHSNLEMDKLFNHRSQGGEEISCPKLNLGGKFRLSFTIYHLPFTIYHLPFKLCTLGAKNHLWNKFPENNKDKKSVKVLDSYSLSLYNNGTLFHNTERFDYMTDKRVSSVQSVERAVAILKSFSPDKQEIGVGEISRRVKLPKSTTFRLLSTLEMCGFVAQDSASGLYRLGVELIPLANSVYYYTDLRQIARPYLQRLVDTLRETASFTVLVDKSVVNLEQIVFSGRLVVRAGGASNRMPFYATSSGKAIVAFLPPQELNLLLDGILVSLTSATITNRESLEEELAQIRQQGYATAYEELEEGLHALAAPIFNHEEEVVACLSISGPSYRLTESRINEIASQVIKSADQISKETGSARR